MDTNLDRVEVLLDGPVGAVLLPGLEGLSHGGLPRLLPHITLYITEFYEGQSCEELHNGLLRLLPHIILYIIEFYEDDNLKGHCDL